MLGTLKHRHYWLLIFLCCPLAAFPQSELSPTARFTFNNGTIVDDINGNSAKLQEVNFAEDRFGNKNSAVFVTGAESSYINLGSYAALKPRSGSISLWVKIEHPIWSGTGILYNPIILTKRTSYDDFYEAYAIYYMLQGKKIVALASLDSTTDVGLFSQEVFARSTWRHLVLSYDDTSLSLYIDGVLQRRLPKRFTTTFLEGDSVILGNTANKKNNRRMNGLIDDVAFFDKVLTAEEVNTLYHAPDPNKGRIIVHWILSCVATIAVIALLASWIRYQVQTKTKKEKEKLELGNKLLETELRVNRASMNPHFLFNSLNTLHNFILANENDNASDYLIKFSTLIRKVLDSNMHDSITLELEIELLERYLEIENLRFKEDIKYTINTNIPVAGSSLHIPLMMLQPFVENAIWHGLRNKTGEKRITVSFTMQAPDYIHCVIEDNGTGRKTTTPNAGEKKSLATYFVSQRLELLNRLYHLQCSLSIEDKPQQGGTIVRLVLPLLNK